MHHETMRDPGGEDVASITAAPGPGASRCSLLGAAGGMALAASGLFVPSWLTDEAEAGDRHHRRHQQRRRKQQRRRTQRRTGILFKDVAFDVTNDLDEHLSGDGWYRFNQFWYAIPFSVNAHAEAFVAHKNSDNLVIVPSYRYYIQANNPYLGTPWVTLAWGGVMGKTGWSGGTTVINEKVLEVDESVEMTVEGKRFTVKRTADDADYKRFRVRIEKA